MTIALPPIPSSDADHRDRERAHFIRILGAP